jgi:hypothetical protein
MRSGDVLFMPVDCNDLTVSYVLPTADFNTGVLSKSFLARRIDVDSWKQNLLYLPGLVDVECISFSP